MADDTALHVRAARWLMGRSLAAYRLELARRKVVSRATRQGSIRRYLGAHPVRALQLGTGHNVLPGWLNTDVHVFRRGLVEFLDATRPFPLPEASFDFVYSEHQIEHVPLAAGDHMLAECFRVLRPGGVVRIATPDLARIARLAQAPLGPDETYYVEYISRMLGLTAPDPTRVINAMFREFGPDDASGHQFIYSFETLSERLRAAGFTDVRRCDVGRSEHAMLRDVERHADAVGDARAVRYETLVVEATRPASAALKVRAGARAGFTLIELVVVIAVIAVLAAVVAPNVFKSFSDANSGAARQQIEQMGMALDSYRLDNHAYPTTEQGLGALRTEPTTGAKPPRWRGPYLRKAVPDDPWGKPYVYVSPGRHDPQGYDLYSLGRDGREGGEGEDADVTSWGKADR
ncbi:type II secretion system major pseudopilin GspG [Longimicrobium sp.]|uniref:type II secretion system major pseudopilin GspG n=1 Tax=Longimicrobium sp. TaxID=2029185 RepID=UPI002E371EA9|nr:type II secretion system major pseudopilin GspG [Longimicrobium sp.]HEX6041743.1 type II secretion system major pseudopilin GspG [Longimicrobium sp.]